MFLSARQAHATFAHVGIVAVGRCADEIVRPCQLGHFDDFRTACIGFAIGDIFGNGASEQVNILLYHADLLAQTGQ